MSTEKLSLRTNWQASTVTRMWASSLRKIIRGEKCHWSLEWNKNQLQEESKVSDYKKYNFKRLLKASKYINEWYFSTVRIIIVKLSISEGKEKPKRF